MKYAIVESGGKQYKAVEGEAIHLDRLPIQVGQEIQLEQVLLLVDEANVTVGTPTVKDMNVFVKVVEHFKGPKVVIFKYSPKKRIRVKTGHRQNYTRLQVEQIGAVKTAAVARAEMIVEFEPPEVTEVPMKPAKAPAKEKAAKAPKATKVEKAPEKAKATKAAKTSKAPAETKASKTAKTPKATATKKTTKTTKTTTASKTKKAEKK
ncbi:MAG: 50S ribosomal protein L21 [Anaerolineales bacterium]|nr:50S ribosomal protein L21 [Anaerolineales bacterium]